MWGPSLCPTDVPPQRQSPSCSLPPGHPEGTEPHSAVSPPACGDSPAQDRALGASVLTQHRATAQGRRLDPSSRSPEPQTRLRHGKGGCAGDHQAGRREGDRILTLLFSPAKIIPVAYKKKGQRQ